MYHKTNFAFISFPSIRKPIVLYSEHDKKLKIRHLLALRKEVFHTVLHVVICHWVQCFFSKKTWNYKCRNLWKAAGQEILVKSYFPLLPRGSSFYLLTFSSLEIRSLYCMTVLLSYANILHWLRRKIHCYVARAAPITKLQTSRIYSFFTFFQYVILCLKYSLRAY